MVVKYSRAQRLHDRARMYKKARKLQESWWNWPNSIGDPLWGGGNIDENTIHQAACKIRDNLKWCSCTMCCNQRRGAWNTSEMLTMQERRAIDAYYDGLEELKDE